MANKQEKSNTKVTLFLKKNVYIILMIICVMAIAAMITVAAVMNSKNNTNINANENNDGNNTVVITPNEKENNTDIENPTKDDSSVVKPTSPEPVVTEFILIAPVVGEIGQGYEDTLPVYHATQKHWKTHEWVNFMAAAGSEVKCAFDGKITGLESSSYYGTVVEVDHGNGYSTEYKLLDNVSLNLGDEIKQGEIIGTVSGTALAEISEGEHLHFALKKDGEYINPIDFMLEGNK